MDDVITAQAEDGQLGLLAEVQRRLALCGRRSLLVRRIGLCMLNGNPIFPVRRVPELAVYCADRPPIRITLHPAWPLGAPAVPEEPVFAVAVPDETLLRTCDTSGVPATVAFVLALHDDSADRA